MLADFATRYMAHLLSFFRLLFYLNEWLLFGVANITNV